MLKEKIMQLDRRADGFSFLFRSIHCRVQAHGHVVSGGGLKPFLFGSEDRLLNYVSDGGGQGSAVVGGPLLAN